MNMNLDLVNRALHTTGQNLLDKSDKESAIYKLCKAFYIATFLEALSEVEWVGGRKRSRLVLTGRPVLKNKKFLYAYDMPFDCAKPIELQDNDYFIVEDRLIITDVPDAELLYVSNGKILRPIAAAVMELGERPESEYLSAGPPGTIQEYTLYPGEPADIEDEFPDDPDPKTDYPDYYALDYEPKLFEYIEKKLAAKLAMKLSDQLKLHSKLFEEALLVKQEAIDASRASRAAKVKEDAWWTSELGLC